MAINYELINQGSMSVGGGFTLLSKNPLDARLVVPALTGLQNLIDNGAVYPGLTVYSSAEKKFYQVIEGTSGYTYKEVTFFNEQELKDLIASETTAAMEFKGATATIPTGTLSDGDLYKVTAAVTVAAANDAEGKGFTTKVGDSIVYKSGKWYLIPSGDDAEDTWRPVTGVDNASTITFANGDNTTASVNTDGTVKFNHNKLTSAPADIATEEDKKTRTYLTAVEVDDYGHVTNYKTATENVEDTDTTYEFTSQTDDENSNVYFQVTPSGENAQTETIYLDAYTKNEADNKFKTKQTAKTGDTLSGAKVISKLDQDANGEISITTRDLTAGDLGLTPDNYKTKQTAKNFNEGSTTKTVTSVTQDANGEINVTYGDIAFPDSPTGSGAVTTATKNADGSVTLNGGVKLNDHTLEDDTTKDDVTLHKVVTTGSIYDMAEGSVENTGTDAATNPKYIVFNCGSSKTVI